MNAKSKNISNSSWLDADDAPELTKDDFAKGQWFKGDTQINAQEGKKFFRQMLKNSVNTPLDYDIVEYFKAKENDDSYINRINDVLRRAIEQEQHLKI